MRTKAEGGKKITSINPQQSRVGKRVIAAHFDEDSYEYFKSFSKDQLKSTDLLLHEAVAELFKIYKRPIPKAILNKLKIRGVEI